MLKKTIPFFIITASAVLIISGITLFTKAAPQPANTSEELQVQKQLVISYIESADLLSAQAEFDNLIANFGDAEEIVPAVYDIAERYRHTQNYQTSINTYKFILDNYPDSEQAVWAQAFIAVDYIALSSMQNAQAETEILLQQYDGNPNLAAAVTEIGGSYHWFGKYPQADVINELVLERWPDSQPALWAGMNLITSKIATGDLTEASAGLEQFWSKHSDDERLPEALFYIAGSYTWNEKYNEAQDIYYYIADQFTESEWAKNAEFESAKVAIYPLLDANDEPNALAAIDYLIADFADRNDLAASVYDLAARYDQPNNKNLPKELIQTIYQQLIDYFPENPLAQKAELSIERINITLLIEFDYDAGAFEAIDTLIADFNNHPDLPMAVSLISESYYNKGLRLQNKGLDDQAAENYRKSITISEIVIQQLPPSDLTTRAYYFTGVLYSQYLQQYQKAIEYFQDVVDNWPDYQFAWDAQYFIGYYYEKLRDSGAIAESEANPKIEQAYQAVVERYPDSGPAPYVAIKLGRLNFEKEQWSQAVMYFEFFLEKYPDKFGLVVLPLGQAYEKMGESEMAIEIYRAFIDSADPSESRMTKTVKTWLEKLER